MDTDQTVVSAERVIQAPPQVVFDLIADPSQQPRWDGNDNLAHSDPGQRVHAVGDVFTTTLTRDGAVRQNHVVEFEEGRTIAWRPSEVGQEPPGHLWRWELSPHPDGGTHVRHTYDWSELTDENRKPRARATTPDMLLASIDALAKTAESGAGPH